MARGSGDKGRRRYMTTFKVLAQFSPRQPTSARIIPKLRKGGVDMTQGFNIMSPRFRSFYARTDHEGRMFIQTLRHDLNPASFSLLKARLASNAPLAHRPRSVCRSAVVRMACPAAACDATLVL